MIVACVMRSGGEYKPEHVERLRDGVARHLPGARLVCFSDVDVPCDRIPLRFGWPGWWSKQSLFDPSIEDDLLYFDLDMIIVGDLADMAQMNGPTIMRDVYRSGGLQSSLMFIPQSIKATVWDKWIESPDLWMRRYHRGGDQAFLETVPVEWARWQDVLPGQIVSWKVDVRKTGVVPSGTRVVAFHGRPRPWETPLWKQ